MRGIDWRSSFAVVVTWTAFAGCVRLADPETYGGRQEVPADVPDRAAAGRTMVATTTASTEDTTWVPHVDSREWAYMVLHHTASDFGNVESIHRVHSQRRDAAGNPWRGIGYHFVIGNGRGMDDGGIEATFRWREQLAGAHAGVNPYNERGIGICLVGDFEKHPPTAAQIESLKRLVDFLGQEYGIPPQRVLRHGDLKATDCPGKLFPMNDVIPVQSVSVSRPS
ncbi:MAG: N-acetylmuramoyl-L-alanine amidase, partial [Planctomycetaceae bacterium]|nr:N-acetylmuramoyl-L-alanine amidase [Planctomycetaceae bacterium]